MNTVSDYFELVKSALDSVDLHALNRAIDRIWQCYVDGGTIFTFGNGGSSSTASHFTGDMIKGLSYNNMPRFKSICLSDNQAGLLAIANDIDYADIFVEPLKNFLSEKDIVIGFSGSGNSPNIIKAIEYANNRHIDSIGCSGFSGGRLKALSKISVHVNVDDMEAAEDCHLAIGHSIKKELMHRLQLK